MLAIKFPEQPDLWSVVLGALFALLAQAFVQLYIVPRVGAQRSREERWHEDVLALGDLLTTSSPELLRSLESHASMLVFMRGMKTDPDVDQQKLEERTKEETRSLRATDREASTLFVRIDWLASRIASIAPTAPRLLAFSRAAMMYRVFVVSLGFESEVVSEEKLHDTATKARKFQDELLELTKQLSLLGRPPRSTVFGRTRSRLYKMWGRCIKWWRAIRDPGESTPGTAA